MAAFFGNKAELLRSLRVVQGYERDDVGRIDALMAIEEGKLYLHAHLVDIPEFPFKNIFRADPATCTLDLIKRGAACFFPHVVGCLDPAVSMLNSKFKCALAIKRANDLAPQHPDGGIPQIRSEAALYNLWRTMTKWELHNGQATLPGTRVVIREAQRLNGVTDGAITPASVRDALRYLGFVREAVSSRCWMLP